MKGPVIGIDCDGVLADFSLAFTSTINFLKPTAAVIPRHVNDQRFWDWTKESQITKEMVNEAWRFVRDTPGWWTQLEPIPKWQEIATLNHLAMMTDVMVITHRPRKNGSVISETRAWLDHVGLKKLGLVVTDDKTNLVKDLRLDMMLDDLPENLEEMEKSFRGLDKPFPSVILMKQPYNQPGGDVADHQIKEQVKDLSEFFQVVRKRWQW